MPQTKQRLFGGDTQAPEKLVSLFEPSTEIIPKSKAAKPTECGKLCCSTIEMSPFVAQ